jgi:hypothetical protein
MGIVRSGGIFQQQRISTDWEGLMIVNAACMWAVTRQGVMHVHGDS